jgi:hypothetical protein
MRTKTTRPKSRAIALKTSDFVIVDNESLCLKKTKEKVVINRKECSKARLKKLMSKPQLR